MNISKQLYDIIMSGGTSPVTSASGENITKSISQASHGFSVKDVVGFSGSTYNKPIANGLYDGEILGLVTKVPNSGTFELTQAGYITGLTSLVANTTYFLSDVTAGLLTSTEPTGDTHISKTIFFADSTSTGWVLPYAGYVVTTGTSSGGGTWGTITGTLSDQTDLWDAITGNTVTVDAVLSTGSTNAIQNQAVATVINQIMSVIAVAPTYTAPTANLTAGLAQTVEMGTTITNATANISFTQGDAGAVTGYELCRNAVSYSTSQNNSVTDSNVTSSISYVGKVSYACGATKNNNLGIPDTTGKIVAGTVSSPTRTITPVLKQFWGNSSAVPATSTDVRNLSSNNFATTNSFTLTTGTVNTVFAVAIPNTKSITSVIDTGNLNLNVTSQYILINGSFNVNDIGSNARAYKLYAMQPAIPYSTSTSHVITVA